MISKAEQRVIDKAITILEREALSSESFFESVVDAKKLARLHIAALDREVFGAFFLTAQHQMIAFEVLFLGTINESAVHPREVVKAALAHNAAAVVLVHNHPSGFCEPSKADAVVTERLREALDMVGVRVLDHLIVSVSDAYSFAEQGRL